MDEKRVFGYCVECGAEITDEHDEYFVNEEGELMCCIECVLEHHFVHKMEV
jgi:hypothetical protein